MFIQNNFAAGNIEVLSVEGSSARLRIRKDTSSDFFQWFYFRVTGVRDAQLELLIENAGDASYPDGWENYRACVSHDRRTWFRTETHYENGALLIRHRPRHDHVYVAYFAPYSLERHADLIADTLQSDLVRHEVVGRSVQGRDIDLIHVGEGAPIWVIARQHPGESMAEWWMKGFLERVTDPDDPAARTLRAKASLHIVPNMNPDGSSMGHLRTNAVGANLNREWQNPTAERSPEVLAVRERKEQTGVDAFLDVHGDEALPYNFIAGPHGVPSLQDRQLTLLDHFEKAMMAATPDFQMEHGYPEAAPGQGNMTMATTWIAERFGCLSATLEQPFKDNANAPDELCGWSPERCRALGRAAVDAFLAVIDDLRS